MRVEAGVQKLDLSSLQLRNVRIFLSRETDGVNEPGLCEEAFKAILVVQRALKAPQIGPRAWSDDLIMVAIFSNFKAAD